MLTRLKNKEQSNVWSKQQAIVLVDRFAALSSTNRSFHSINTMLENIQNRLDVIEAGTPRSDQGSHRIEEQYQAGRNIREQYTDQSKEEDPESTCAKQKQDLDRPGLIKRRKRLLHITLGPGRAQLTKILKINTPDTNLTHRLKTI